MVGVDTPDEPEDMARKLLAGAGDHRLDGLASLGGGQRVGVSAIFGPQLGDGAASSIGIRLVQIAM